MNSKKTRLQQAGFTLIEIVIGLMVITISLSSIYYVQSFTQQKISELNTRIEGNIDALFGERIILKDMQAALPSFNNLYLADDLNRQFYDYMPDLPTDHIANPERTITLSASGAKKDIIMMLQDNSKGPLLLYNPLSAYVIGPAPNDYNIAATLNFASINQNNWVSTVRPLFWQNGNLLLLDTGSKLRYLPANGNINLQQPPRSSLFVGRVLGSKLEPDSNVLKLTKITHPETNEVIDSADKFLRSVSAAGGGIPIVRLQTIKIVRYTVIPSPTKPNAGQLIRTEYNPSTGNYEKSLLISDLVDYVLFQRKTIATKLINIKIANIPVK